MQKSMIKLLSIADYISLINAIFGFLSLTMIYIGEIRIAFSFILLAILADGLDGIIARKTHESRLGEYLDSMADMISFGIAPAFFVFSIYYNDCSCFINKNVLLFIILIFFISLSIIRLASFPIMKNKKYFFGLPVPSSAIILNVMAYFGVDLRIILPLVLIISFLMISKVKFPKLGLKINAIACVLIFLTIIFDKNYAGFAPLILFSAIALYTIAGPIYFWIRDKKPKKIQ